MGFVTEENTYLRDGWNILDFLVVITSILSLIGSVNLSAVRTVRVLRPLRSINVIPGLRLLVGSLLDSLPDLGNVVVFLIFIIALFGILGLQIFLGVFENRCRFTPLPLGDLWLADPTLPYLCFEDDDTTCPPNRYCRNPASHYIKFQDNELYFP